ncbi:hypothetical protein D3H55_13815 [Bacillus salacetis]|uniref:Uncharacterized protein n=1 Tax=Bacillus salacetis TaxID=2315464 RepID=A0A3A1QYG6_9BACI|nr:hypothetical protein [Bacillus salacetis]RIW32340.1 hypothetical protein D3H55_13815 [Bacillus salacetis]
MEMIQVSILLLLKLFRYFREMPGVLIPFQLIQDSLAETLRLMSFKFLFKTLSPAFLFGDVLECPFKDTIERFSKNP